MRLAATPQIDLTARRVLRAHGRGHADTLRHLSTGLRVTRGRDAPAALIAAEVLRQDRTRAEQVADAAELARAATGTAEAALGEANRHLLELRRLAGESHTNTLSPEQRAANQQQADALVEEIDRLLTGATYKGRKLFQPPPADLGDGPLTFDAAGDIGSPTAAGSHVTTTPPGGPASFQVTGSNTNFGNADNHYFLRNTHAGDGVLEVAVPDFVAPDPFARAGPMWRESDDPRAPNVSTYRFADGGIGLLYRETFNGPTIGVGGAASGDADPTYFRLTRSGDDFTGAYSNDGVTFTPIATVTVAMSPAAHVGVYAASNSLSAHTFDVTDVRFAAGLVPASELPPPGDEIPYPAAGTLPGDPPTPEQTALLFNLGTDVRSGPAALRLGRLDARTLGTPANVLADLKTGGELQLLDAGNPDNAARVIDAAIKQVSTARGRVANFERHIADPLGRQGQRQAGHLAAAGSRVADTDFAAATAELARLEVLRRGVGGAVRVSVEQRRRLLDLLP